MATRRFASRAARLSTVGVAMVLALAVVGCGSLGSGRFAVEHPRTRGPLPIVLDDSTGKVISLALGQQLDGRERFGIDRADGLLPTVEVWWVGRECDERVAITIDRAGERFRLEVKVTTAARCEEVPVSRSVLLTFADSIRAEDFDVIVPAGLGRPPMPVLPVPPVAPK